MLSTDQRLLQAHCQGDPDAFGQIVRGHGPAVLGYLIRMCSDRDMAEDYLQETFKRLHEKAPTIEGRAVRQWLFKVATNIAMDGFRKKKRQPAPADRDPVDLEPAVDPGRGPSEDLVHAEQARQVRAALASLPARQRTTLVLAYYQKLTYPEVAQILGCSVGTVKTQMSRALHALAKKLPDPS